MAVAASNSLRESASIVYQVADVIREGLQRRFYLQFGRHGKVRSKEFGAAEFFWGEGKRFYQIIRLNMAVML